VTLALRSERTCCRLQFLDFRPLQEVRASARATTTKMRKRSYGSLDYPKAEWLRSPRPVRRMDPPHKCSVSQAGDGRVKDMGVPKC